MLGLFLVIVGAAQKVGSILFPLLGDRMKILTTLKLSLILFFTQPDSRTLWICQHQGHWEFSWVVIAYLHSGP